MAFYNIAEKFISINGEGAKAGQPAVFIRFAKCNLRCSYCDTMWANSADAAKETMTEEQLHEYIIGTGIRNVTLTGGEPLIQPDMDILLERLCADERISVEIETNGSAHISPFTNISRRPSFTLDYKLPSSGMEKHMLTENYKYLGKTDSVKFVAGSHEDLERAYEIISEYGLTEKCRVFFSPVFGKIAPSEIVDFMLERRLNGVNMQLQLHKFIWDPDMRGV
ncbi:MAG: putative 7-carboxy-7-deazaguanine synthase QueE [Oscillospiraceae bacterium]